jgi:hypothetical protein
MIDQLRRKSSSISQRGRQGAMDGIRRRVTIRWLSVFSALSSVALFSVAGAWTISEDAFEGGAGAFVRRLTFDKSINSAVDGGNGPFASARPFSQPAIRGKVQSAFFLAGISGEALVTSPLTDTSAGAFTATRFPFATPVNFSSLPVIASDFVADKIMATTVSASEPHRPAVRLASSDEARPQKVQPADPNALAPDYALVFSQQPVSGSGASLQAICLRAEWRAVIEPLIMNAEPKPEVVHNL